jgi:hypothetical protein
MKIAYAFHNFFVLVITMSVAGCGNGSSGSNSAAIIQMGGSIQGKTLTLSSAVTTLAGTLSGGSTDGIGVAATFNGPDGITTDGVNLFITDSGNHTIRKIVISSGAVTTLAGTAETVGSTDGIGAAASFFNLVGITTDGANLYVTDSAFNTIRKIVISTGTVTTLAGTAATSGSTDGTGVAARFHNPQGITTDGTNLYVADAENRTIRKIVISSGVVTTLAGAAGTFGSVDGIGSAARFYSLQGISTDGTNLYVVDGTTIRKIVISTGTVTTFAGTVDVFGSADGIGTSASFNLPYGITTDGTTLYVTERNNQTIRKIVIATVAVTTLAGTAGTSGSADGIGTGAQFHDPRGITTDGANLYISDCYNNTIRQIH